MKTVTAYGFDMQGGVPVMAMHMFNAGNDGQLEHYVDGYLRAQVPPEGWEGYIEQYKEAAPVVAYLRPAPAPAAIVPPVVDQVAEQIQAVAPTPPEVQE